MAYVFQQKTTGHWIDYNEVISAMIKCF